MLFSLNVEKSKKSLIVRNEIIEKLFNELGVNFGFSFNDLYGVKGGVVRRLKGGISNEEIYKRGEFRNNEVFNKLFNEVKEYLENLEFEGFKIEFNKLKDISFNDYLYYRNRRDFDGNFLDYKKLMWENERTCILKIKWDV